MSQGPKIFERPKVRFSQPSHKSTTNSETPSDEGNLNSTTNKPRIISIVNLKDPYKIIHENKNLPSTSKGNVNYTETNHSTKRSASDPDFQRHHTSNLHKADSKGPSDNPGPPSSQKSSECIVNTKNLSHRDNSSIDTTGCSAVVPNSVQNSKALTSVCISKSSESTIRKNTSTNSATSVSKDIEQAKTGAIPKIGKVCTSRIGARHATPKTVTSSLKKSTKKTAIASNENIVPDKNSISTKNGVLKITRQKEKTSEAITQSSCNINTAKTVSRGLKISKPGTKTWKTRPKSSPVKKSILRNITGYPTNVYVGPGVAKYYSHPFKIGTEKEPPHIRPDIVSEEKLGRPEYNSIMCTIDELKKVQSEKFITDVEHLPIFYRNLVNEKVSMALDFPPDEAIYKNLVDLSVNENQLPSRVTRSKDPEPRNRDVVPKLSDFFTPAYSEEYCTAVQIRPSSPEIFSNWSAFAISDKIFGWKHDMDQCY